MRRRGASTEETRSHWSYAEKLTRASKIGQQNLENRWSPELFEFSSGEGGARGARGADILSSRVHHARVMLC
jgi:hypothetical protein